MLVPFLIFAVAAAGGLTMVVLRLRGRPYPPVILPVVHGLAVSLAASVLAYYYPQGAPDGSLGRFKLVWALLAAAAAGGLTLLLAFHARKKALPVVLVLGHGLLGLAAIGLLATLLRP